MFHEFETVDYNVLGSWRNRWGYVTTIATFDEDDIVVKTITPHKTKLIRHFDNWETCEEFIDLIEADRRY